MTTPPGEGNNTDNTEDGEEGGQTPPVATGSAGTAEGDADDEWEKDRAKVTITNLRDREKTLSKQLSEKDRELKKLQDASRTEQERKDAELEELRALKTKYESEKREQNTRSIFMREAQRLGATRPDALFKLSEGLELEDDGTPTNAPAVLRDLKRDYPEMFGAGGGSADGGAGRGQAPSTPSMNDRIRAAMQGR